MQAILLFKKQNEIEQHEKLIENSIHCVFVCFCEEKNCFVLLPKIDYEDDEMHEIDCNQTSFVCIHKAYYLLLPTPLVCVSRRFFVKDFLFDSKVWIFFVAKRVQCEQ